MQNFSLNNCSTQSGLKIDMPHKPGCVTRTAGATARPKGSKKDTPCLGSTLASRLGEANAKAKIASSQENARQIFHIALLLEESFSAKSEIKEAKKKQAGMHEHKQSEHTQTHRATPQPTATSSTPQAIQSLPDKNKNRFSKYRLALALMLALCVHASLALFVLAKMPAVIELRPFMSAGIGFNLLAKADGAGVPAGGQSYAAKQSAQNQDAPLNTAQQHTQPAPAEQNSQPQRVDSDKTKTIPTTNSVATQRPARNSDKLTPGARKNTPKNTSGVMAGAALDKTPASNNKAINSGTSAIPAGGIPTATSLKSDGAGVTNEASGIGATGETGGAGGTGGNGNFGARALGGGVNRKPHYPALARQRGQQGEVLVRVKVNASGLADKVNLERSSGYALLDKAALDAVKKWQFTPAQENGKPTGGYAIIPIEFRLE